MIGCGADVALAREPIEGSLRRVAALRYAKVRHNEMLLGVAHGEAPTVGSRRRTAVRRRAEAE